MLATNVVMTSTGPSAPARRSRVIREALRPEVTR
jgi:hypothetical protein